MTDPTGPLAEFIADLKYSDLPPRVRDRVHLITVDAVANALAGWQATEMHSIAATAKALGGAGNSTVFGGTPLSLAAAVFLNAYLITAVSACDVYRPAFCHVTPEVVPPALAIAERDAASGEAWMVAVAAGLETTVRLGLGLHYAAFRSHGWHSPGVIGPFGGAAAVGKLLGMNAQQLQNALGLAGSQASGTFATFGTAAVKFHQSHGALAGLTAGLLAAENFRTTGEILTHRDGGLFNAMSDGGDPEAVTSGLGEQWELENISLRQWPTAAALQSVVSALVNLVERHDLMPENVRKVKIALPKSSYEMNGTMGWGSRLSAMLSARYVASVVLHDRACWLDQFDAPHLADPRITNFAESGVEVFAKESIEWDGANVTVVTANGEEWTEERNYPRGDPREPLTEDQVVTKLRVFGNSQLGTDRVRHVAGLLSRLEHVENIRSLCAALARGE